MRILLDENLPHRLRHYFPQHEVATVTYRGWAGIRNGALLAIAEKSFDVLLTMDQGITHQQNLSGRKIAIIVLNAYDNALETIEPLVPQILDALDRLRLGEVVNITV